MMNNRKNNPAYQLVLGGEIKTEKCSNYLMQAMRNNHILLYSTVDKKALLYDSYTHLLVTQIPYQIRDKHFCGELTLDVKPVELSNNRVVSHYVSTDRMTRKTILWDPAKNATVELDDHHCIRYSLYDDILACIDEENIRFFDLSEKSKIPQKMGSISKYPEKKFSDVIWISPKEISVLLHDGTIAFYEEGEFNQFKLTSSPITTNLGKDFKFCIAKSKQLILSCSHVTPQKFFLNVAEYAQTLYCQIKIYSAKDKSCIDYVRINNFFTPTLLTDETHIISTSQDKNLNYKIAIYNLKDKMMNHVVPEYPERMKQQGLCFLESGRIIAHLKFNLKQDVFLVYTPRFILLKEQKLLTAAVHEGIDRFFKGNSADVFPKDIARIVGEYAAGVTVRQT